MACGRVLLVLLACSVRLVCAQQLAPEPGGRPVSPAETPAEKTAVKAVPVNKAGVTHYGKISVVGADQNLRGSIASMAEELRVELDKLCGEPRRESKLPIIIRLYGKLGDHGKARSIASQIRQVQGQFQILLHIHLGKGIDHALLRYHLMEVLLYERGLGAGQVLEEGERVIVRPWLVVGLLESIDIKAGRADRRIYQAEIPFLEIMGLQRVFDTTEKQWRAMIGREPAAFRAVAGAMVNALLRQPGGRAAMVGYLADFATFKGENENLMRKHFPGMNTSSNSLQKWVSLGLLELGTARMTQVYSILETDRRLDGILKLRFRGKNGEATTVDIDGYAAVLELKPEERFEAVAGARAELERLSYRSFPTYRPLLNEYEAILREVIAGKDRGIEARLGKLMDVRLKMKDAGKRVRDYLDWYYITSSNKVDGDFEKYMKVKRALDAERLRPPADDSTQRYLDQVQKLYGGR